MKLYFAPNTRAVRIAWLLEELGLDYELERFELGQKAMREPPYTDVHPAGRVPALQDGDTILVESIAIMEYLIARYGPTPLAPNPGDPSFGPYLQFLHLGELPVRHFRDVGNTTRFSSFLFFGRKRDRVQGREQFKARNLTYGLPPEFEQESRDEKGR
jgi:glutathione S-transferase